MSHLEKILQSFLTEEIKKEIIETNKRNEREFSRKRENWDDEKDITGLTLHIENDTLVEVSTTDDPQHVIIYQDKLWEIKEDFSVAPYYLLTH